MSIDNQGIKSKLESGSVTIFVSDDHPLIKLANSIDWERLYEIILPDLKASCFKGLWWLGRKLKVRIHLAAYILQQLYNKTDRQTEYSIKDNCAYQLFCGLNIVDKFHCPDHTKIEEFRSRLSPSTQNKLANEIAVLAVHLGYADASCMDIDSTTQEANMSYPSDVNLLVKIAKIAHKVWVEMQNKISHFKLYDLKLNLREIKSKARSCFFDKKKENKSNNLLNLWKITYDEVMKILKYTKTLTLCDINRFSWNSQRALAQLQEHAAIYLKDVTHYVINGTMKEGKALSFHLKEVSCFPKNTVGEVLKFGRRFQLGRLEGNFLLIKDSSNVREEDKKTLGEVINLHENLFGVSKLHSVATDKGYYSKENKDLLIAKNIVEIGLQQPRHSGSLPPDIREELKTKLVNRRAGIEPLIGHCKHRGQLGQSRMKSDKTTLSASYSSVFSFNLRQITRNLMGKTTPQAA
jgi:hypothetical protein